jgi:hypothetical protein
MTQPSMRSTRLSTGLATMRKLAVLFNYEGTSHRNVNSNNYKWCCTSILTYSGHRGSIPLFITNWVKVLHHFNSVCHPHISDKSSTFFIQLSNSGTHILNVQYISAQNWSHSSSSLSLHFYASCSFTFMGIKLWFSLSSSYSEFRHWNFSKHLRTCNIAAMLCPWQQEWFLYYLDRWQSDRQTCAISTIKMYG